MGKKQIDFNSLLVSGLGEMLKGAQSSSGEWWNSFQYPDIPNFDSANLLNCAKSALFASALSGDFHVVETWHSKPNVNSNYMKFIDEFIKTINGKLVYHYKYLHDWGEFMFFIFKGGAMSVEITITESTPSAISVDVRTVSVKDDIGKKLIDKLIGIPLDE